MRILIATDAFPPVCGGSGWSTYELVRGLRERGHEVAIVQPRPGYDRTHTIEYDGFEVRQIAAAAPNVPYVRNYFKNERLHRRLVPRLRRIIREEDIDVVHGQHVLTAPPAVTAARAEGVPVVCTIRDYWPLCYWSDLIVDPRSDALCPACTPARMTRCIRPRGGAAWPLALPLIPYMRRNLAGKRRALRAADAVIAVSSAIAHDLRHRAPELSAVRVETIPNPVDTDGVRAAADRPRPAPAPYAIYVGKLAPNKGVMKLLPALDRASLALPLVVVGEGPDRGRLEDAAARSGRDVRFTGWLDRSDALAWLRHAAFLIFPSHGPESLSRVLLEASALGVPIAAMDTGGTRDIISNGETGLLSRNPEALGDDVARLARDPALRARLGLAARDATERRFGTRGVVNRIEALYRELAKEGR